MLRFGFRIRRCLRFHHHRYISASSSFCPKKPVNPSHNAANLPVVTTPVSRDHLPGLLPPPPTSSFSRSYLIAVSALLASVAYLSYDSHNQRRPDDKPTNPLLAGVEHAIHKSTDSFNMIFRNIKRTSVAVSVLWQSLTSVLSSANHEVRSGFEIRVAALLADIAAANSSRRAAIVGAGGGAVVDWLLESVAVANNGGGTQAESARALAYLIADPNVSAIVLGRPHAIPNLLNFIFSCHPRRLKKVALYLRYISGL